MKFRIRNSKLMSPMLRDKQTLAYGHNKALVCWFFLCRNNANPIYARLNTASHPTYCECIRRHMAEPTS